MSRPATLDELLARARVRLAAAPFRPSTREAALLLGHVLGLSEAQLLAHGREVAPADAVRRFESLLERRLGGEPVAYLRGEREFYGRSFAVDDRVLIPRPESEHLVEAALAAPLPAAPRILDIGTGSGCLAVTLALELPRARVLATDLSPAALAVARANVRRHGVTGRVALAASDLVAALRLGGIDLVISNPPYVDRREAASLSPEVVAFEPALALFSAPAGLGAIAALVAAAGGLRAGTALLLEIGVGQLPAVERLVAASPLQIAAAWKDYSSIARVVRLEKQP
jgi:release factor glutamine methyltransferase